MSTTTETSDAEQKVLDFLREGRARITVSRTMLSLLLTGIAIANILLVLILMK